MKTADGGEKVCARCGEDEFRINGFCSTHCEDMAGVETERDELRTFKWSVEDAVIRGTNELTQKLYEWAQMPPTKWDSQIRDGARAAQAEVLAILREADERQDDRTVAALDPKTPTDD